MDLIQKIGYAIIAQSSDIRDNGIYALADAMTVATLQDMRKVCTRNTSEHPEDVELSRRVVEAINVILGYMGET